MLNPKKNGAVFGGEPPSMHCDVADIHDVTVEMMMAEWMSDTIHVCLDWYHFCESAKRLLSYPVAVEPIGPSRRFLEEGVISDAITLELARIQHPERRAARMAGRIAAKRAIRQRFPHLGDSQMSIVNDALGKPEWPYRPQYCVSISHSQEFALAYVGKTPMGIDLEFVCERPECLHRYFFSPHEQTWMNETPLGKNVAGYVIWTRKEAVSKLLGRGGQMAFKNICALDLNSSFSFTSFIVQGYVVSVARYADEVSE